MFTDTLNKLHDAFPGNVIYIPESLKIFVEPFLKVSNKRSSAIVQSLGTVNISTQRTATGYYWNRKEVKFYKEEEVVEAYRKMPIPHTPVSAYENSFIIEFSLNVEPKTTNNKKGPLQEVKTRKGW